MERKTGCDKSGRKRGRNGRRDKREYGSRKVRQKEEGRL